MDALPTGTVTFLFSDIEGSTRLLRALGEDRYRDALEAHQAILRRVFAARHGRTVLTEGDSFFVVFQSARDAVAAAVEVQRELAAAPWPAEAGDRGLLVRIGLHTGEGRLGGDSYVGLDVHRASRIADAANGSQVIISSPTRALVEDDLPGGTTLVDLGEHRLKDLDRPEALSRLVIAGIPADDRRIRSLETPSDLPTPLSSLVGRTREIAEVAALVRAERLVTLTGPGGTGKTRLALAAAAALLGDVPDGASFVELAPILDPGLVGRAIAAALGLREETERPIEATLQEALRDRRYLLVLDNFEQVVAAAPMIGDLLAAAPRLRVLVTSREVLHLRGEHEYPVPPLASPVAGSADSRDPDRLGTYESVALFIARARAIDPAFEVTNANAPAVAEICARLEGLPLAIELAAARTKLFGPEQLLVRLRTSLAVLSGGARDLPERQRTLHGAIAWSYDLLTPAEQTLLRRLGPFVGGWTLEAAEAVVDPEGRLGIDVVDGHASLIDKSLIVRTPGDAASTRFGRLELIREFSIEQLDLTPEAKDVRRRHCRFFLELVEVAEPGLTGAEAATWQAALTLDVDNLRAALRWSIAAGESGFAQRIMGASWRFWHQSGRLAEGRAWADASLADSPTGESGVDRGRALAAAGGLAYWMGDFAAADLRYREALAIARARNDPAAIAEALYNAGFTALTLGAPEDLRARHEEALALFQSLGDEEGAVRVRQGLTVYLMRAHDYPSARALEQENLAYFRRTSAPYRAADSLTLIAQIELVEGDVAAAARDIAEALRTFATADVLTGTAGALQVAAAIVLAAGEPDEAARLLGAVGRFRDEAGLVIAATAVLGMDDPRDEARDRLGLDRFTAAMDGGSTLDRAAAIGEALIALDGS